MPGGQNLFITLLGTTGSGKSTLAAEIIQMFPRVLIIDSMGEYDSLPGAIVREGVEECINALLTYQKIDRWTIDCLLMKKQEVLDILAVAFDVQNMLIVLEEASLYCDPHDLPDEIAQIIRYGRKRNINMLVIARRPSEINRELTAQSHILVTFRQMEPIDVQYLRSRLGDKASHAPHLKPFHVIAGGDMARCPLPILQRIEKSQLTLFEEPTIVEE